MNALCNWVGLLQVSSCATNRPLRFPLRSLNVMTSWRGATYVQRAGGGRATTSDWLHTGSRGAGSARSRDRPRRPTSATSRRRTRADRRHDIPLPVPVCSTCAHLYTHTHTHTHDRRYANVAYKISYDSLTIMR